MKIRALVFVVVASGTLACGADPVGPDEAPAKLEQASQALAARASRPVGVPGIYDGTTPASSPGARTAAPAAAAAACSGLTLTRWPLDGVNGQDWAIHNYVDLDPTTGLKDYTGKTGSQARTYDGHAGADIAIADFRRMDDNSAVIHAAAGGTVTDIVQNNFDRNVACVGNPANYIAVNVGHGYVAYYYHIKKNSARVTVGQTVSAGTILAVVGSAGCSTGAHLHFELQCNGVPVEPFSPNLWSSPPAYKPASNVMDVSLWAQNPAPTDDQLKDPAPDPTVVPALGTFAVGAVVAAQPNDVVHWRLKKPGGALYQSVDYTLTSDFGRFGVWNLYADFTTSTDPGTWTVEVQVNGNRTVTRTFKTSPIPVWNIAEASFQTTFNAMVSAGHRATWIDVFPNGSGFFYNAVFQLSDGRGWYAEGPLTGAQVTSELAAVPAGYRPISLESHVRGGALNYTLIVAEESGAAWTSFVGKTDSQTQTLFNQLTASGYRPLTASVSILNGVRYTSQLYDKSAGGTWTSQTGLTDAQFATLFNQQAAAGNHQSYLDVDVVGGVAQYSVIFNGLNAGGWETWIGLTAAQLGTQNNADVTGGFVPRLVRGYATSGGATFGGIWSGLPLDVN